MLQFGASLSDDTRSVNYDRNTFIIQATGANVIKNTEVNYHGNFNPTNSRVEILR